MSAYVVTFQRDWKRNAQPAKHLRRMTLDDAKALVIFAHPRRGVILDISNEPIEVTE